MKVLLHHLQEVLPTTISCGVSSGLLNLTTDGTNDIILILLVVEISDLS